MKLSTIIITKNAESDITACIHAVKFSDEILVIDNGSTDNTPALAKDAGALLFSVKAKDFSYLRNVGREKANSEWLLYIDADERVSEELSQEIINRITLNDSVAGYTIARKNFFFHRACPGEEKMLRLIKKTALRGWHGVVHETPLVSGTIGEIREPIIHYTHNDISSMVEKTNEWSVHEAYLRFQNNHPRMAWWRFFSVIWKGFADSYIKRQLWKMGTVGLIESIYQAFSMFITYAKLWELQNKVNSSSPGKIL